MLVLHCQAGLLLDSYRTGEVVRLVSGDAA